MRSKGAQKDVLFTRTYDGGSYFMESLHSSRKIKKQSAYMDEAEEPTGYVTAAANVPSPLLARIDTESTSSDDT